jgi:hypothetical protein
VTPTLSSIRRPQASARPLALACLLAGLAAAAGCSTQEKPVYEAVNTKPIVGDDAMAFRADWPRSVCKYPNGDVVAWSTRYPYQANESRYQEANLALDTITFVAETAILPVQLIVNPPGVPQVWYGVKYPPTYTAQPPLPPKGGITPGYAQRVSAQ